MNPQRFHGYTLEKFEFPQIKYKKLYVYFSGESLLLWSDSQVACDPQKSLESDQTRLEVLSLVSLVHGNKLWNYLSQVICCWLSTQVCEIFAFWNI